MALVRTVLIMQWGALPSLLWGPTQFALLHRVPTDVYFLLMKQSIASQYIMCDNCNLMPVWWELDEKVTFIDICSTSKNIVAWQKQAFSLKNVREKSPTCYWNFSVSNRKHIKRTKIRNKCKPILEAVSGSELIWMTVAATTASLEVMGGEISWMDEYRLNTSKQIVSTMSL